VVDERSVTLGDWLDLREQARAAEALLEDLSFQPSNLARYWSLSAGLLALMMEIDEFLELRRENGPPEDEFAVFDDKRRRLRDLLAGSEEISEGTDGDAG
jgi:hypothetical protein